MTNFKRPILIISILVLSVGILAFAYLLNKPRRDVTNETSISIPATKLFMAFSDDEIKANNTYLDKAISVRGIIGEVSRNQQGQTIIILKTDDPMFGVACTLKEIPESKPTAESEIIIKGICSGFTNDVVLRDCVIVD